MNEYRVRRGRPIAGEITVPGDLIISRLAIVIAALANGPSVLTGLLPAQECLAMLDNIVGRGAQVEFLSEEDADTLWEPDPDKPERMPTRARIRGISMASGAKGIIALLPEGPDRDILHALLNDGKTSVPLPPHHPDHVCRILRHYQVRSVERGGMVLIYGGQTPESRDFRVPGDISVAAQWITAAAMQPGSDLTVRGVSLNATRTSFLRVLVGMGAHITEDIWPSRGGETIGAVIVRGAPLHGVKVDARLAAHCPHELSALAVAAAFATGESAFRLPFRLIDPSERIVHHLCLLGVNATRQSDGFNISGNALRPFLSGCLPSYGDPFIAMSFAIAGLFGEGETIVEDIAAVEKTWAGFGHELRHFQSRAISEGIGTAVINTWKFQAPAGDGDSQPQPTYQKS